jgi:hypothetical protein
VRTLNLKVITKNIGIYGLSQTIAAFSALIRLPIAIGYLGIGEFGKMVSLIQILSVPLLFQGAMRLHFRKRFSQKEFDGVTSFIEVQKRLLKFSIRRFILPLAVCLGLSTMLANKYFARDVVLNITLAMILILLFISILPTAIHYGYLDSQSQQNSVISIDIVSSVVSVPLLLIAVYFELSTAFVLCIFTSTLWLPIFVLMYLTRKQKSKSKSETTMHFKIDFHYMSYLKQSLGSSLTLNYNSILFALQTNPVLVAKINIAEKLLSTIFIPTAALAPVQFVNLTKNSSIHNEKSKGTYFKILILNATLTFLFAIPIVLAAYFFSPFLMNQSAGLSLGMILSIAFAYCIYSMYSTLQLINLARIETSQWILNMGILLGLISCALCYVLAARTKDLTLLFSVGLTYSAGSSIILYYLFRNRHFS